MQEARIFAPQSAPDIAQGFHLGGGYDVTSLHRLRLGRQVGVTGRAHGVQHFDFGAAHGQRNKVTALLLFNGEDASLTGRYAQTLTIRISPGGVGPPAGWSTNMIMKRCNNVTFVTLNVSEASYHFSLSKL